MLLGEPQQLLNPCAEAGVGWAFLLLDLTVRLRELALHCLHLLAVLAKLSLELLDVRIDLAPVIAPEHRVELTWGCFLEEIAQLGVDVGLHVARSW